MWYSGIFAIFTIALITNCTADSYPQLYVLNQFGRIVTNTIKSKYEYAMQTSVPKKFQSVIHVEKANASNTLERIVEEFQEKFATLEHETRDIEKCKRELMTAVNQSRTEAYDGLDRCHGEVKKKPLETAFNETIAIGKNYRDSILRAVRFCESQSMISTRDCSDQQVKFMDAELKTYRRKAEEFKETLTIAVDEALAGLKACCLQKLDHVERAALRTRQACITCLSKDSSASG